LVNIVVGIDSSSCQSTLSLLGRLRFEEANVDLVHVVESLLPDRSFPNLHPTHLLGSLMAERERIGNAELGWAEALLQGAGYGLRKSLLRGEPTRVLVELAACRSADVIAVGSTQKGAWASYFFHGVGNYLVRNAEPSILIARTEPYSKEGLAVVLAIEDLESGDACVERLVGWQPRGIRRISVVAAKPQYNRVLERHGRSRPQDSHEEQSLLAGIGQICDRLLAAGIECDFKTVQGRSSEAIEKEAKDREVDLLILGACRHGWWEPWRRASISHFLMPSAHCNTLVLRTQL
jgi:nucleotide-binding universal stress UspA family protein